MGSEPLVTVNILSYNRKEELRNTLTKVLEQDYKNIEVIVVDNASTDGTQVMIRTEFPIVHLIESGKNVGIAGWNKGGKIASGQFILFLDDDSYPETGSILKGVESILSDSKIGVAGFEIFNKNLDLVENKNAIEVYKKKKFSPGFIGCGALVNRNLFVALNGFNTNIFLYHHEYDFSARVYNLGYRVILLEGVRVIHNYSNKNRGKISSKKYMDERKFRYGFISLAVFQIQNFSLRYKLLFVPKLFISRLYVAFRLGIFRSYFTASYYILTNLFVFSKSSSPLRKEIQKLYGFGNIKFNDVTEF